MSRVLAAGLVGDWPRQIAGKRDHREAMPDDDYLVLRPGPNFDWLMGNPVTVQPPLPAPEQDPAGNNRREADDHDQVIRTGRAARG